MVSPISLYIVASVALLLAVVVGRLRRLPLRDALADGCAGLAGTSLFLVTSVFLFAASQSLAAPEFWRDAGSIVLLATPIGAALGLRDRGHRSLPRAVVGAAIAATVVVLWLTLNLRGPRGGWTATEVLLVLPATALAVTSAACAGWWSKTAPVEG